MTVDRLYLSETLLEKHFWRIGRLGRIDFLAFLSFLKKKNEDDLRADVVFLGFSYQRWLLLQTCYQRLLHTDEEFFFQKDFHSGM